MTWLRKPNSFARMEASPGGILVAILVAAAGCCGVLALAGWAAGLPRLAGFGIGNYPVWPMVALGIVFLAAGFLATLARYRVAPWLLAVPLCIALAAAAEAITGASLGIDLLLFPEQVTRLGAFHPGRPGPNGIGIFLCLGLTLLSVQSRRRGSADFETLVAAEILYFGLLSLLLLVVQGSYVGDLSRRLVLPLPASLATVGFAAAFLLWRQGAGWGLLLTRDRAQQPVVRVLMPLAVLLPIVPSLIERTTLRRIDLAPVWTETLAIACNIAVLGTLLWLAVTQLMRQQQALHDSTRALDGAEIAVTDVAGRILLWSRGCEDLYGWSAEQAIGRNKYDLLHSRCDQFGADSYPATATTGERELTERRRDGSRISVIERTHRIDRPDREPRFALRMLDISERVQVEAALRSSEARLRSVLKAAPSPMVVVDDEGGIVEFSPAAEHLWDLTIGEVAGRPLTLLAPPEEHARFRGLLERQLRTEDRDWRQRPVPAIALARDGRRLTVEVSTGRANTPTGTLVTMFFRDVSDRLEGEQRLSDLNAELAHVSRQSAMSELAADLAHELNQPLSATANYLAAARMLIGQGVAGERIADLLRMGEEQTLRSGQIIRRLRDFLAKRDFELRPESIGLAVREAAELVLFGATRFDVRLSYDIDPAADMVFADRIQIQQVLVNLMRNAVQAMRGQPIQTRAIRISSRMADDGMVEVSVADTGPGLPPEIAQQLYARFATTKQGSAMGIGLSISRRIIEAHGGTLAAENRQDGGAVFRFTLSALQELVE